MKKAGTIMVNTKTKNTLDRYFNIAKVLLAVSPFIGIFYITMSQTTGGDIGTVLSQNPDLTVLFLACMINPFIAYLLIFIHKKLKSGEPSYAVINLFLLFLAELMLQNLLYIVAMGILLFKTMKVHNITIREAITSEKRTDLFLTISGSLVVLVLAGICLFAQTRIG